MPQGAHGSEIKTDSDTCDMHESRSPPVAVSPPSNQQTSDLIWVLFLPRPKFSSSKGRDHQLGSKPGKKLKQTLPARAWDMPVFSKDKPFQQVFTDYISCFVNNSMVNFYNIVFTVYNKREDFPCSLDTKLLSKSIGMTP